MFVNPPYVFVSILNVAQYHLALNKGRRVNKKEGPEDPL